MIIDSSKIVRAIEEYNRYRSPEATASLVEIGDGYVVVNLSGSFCISCGIYDWLDDLRYELQDYTGRIVEIADIERIDVDSFRVRYNIY